MDSKIETKFEIEWVSVADELPSPDEEVMVASFNRFCPSATWGEDWETGEPVWFNEYEVELGWTPLFWARHPPLPYRLAPFPRMDTSVNQEYTFYREEDEDGYVSVVQKGEKGKFVWSQVFGVWGAFIDGDSEEPFYYAASITTPAMDAAWQEYLRIVSESKAVGDE